MVISQPHLVQIYPAAKDRNSETNRSERLYDGVTPRQHRGHLQARAGHAVFKSNGVEYNYDCIWYTTTPGMKEDDLILQALPGFDPDHRFVVKSAQPMTNVKGKINHYRCECAKTTSVGIPLPPELPPGP